MGSMLPYIAYMDPSWDNNKPSPNHHILSPSMIINVNTWLVYVFFLVVKTMSFTKAMTGNGVHIPPTKMVMTGDG